MRITLLNYATPETDPRGRGTRWWHKSGARWPATILDRANDGSEYSPWPFQLCYLHSLLVEDGHEVTLLDGCLEKWDEQGMLGHVQASCPDYIIFETSEQTEHVDRATVSALGSIAPVVLIGPNVREDRSDLLEWAGVHSAVPGEFLLSTRDLLRSPSLGMATRQEITGTPNMDALPFAHRDLHQYPGSIQS